LTEKLSWSYHSENFF